MINKIFVLGATGFIGKQLVPKLLQTCEVITVGRSECDITFCLENDDLKFLIDSAKAGDYFIFLASISSPDFCEKNFNHAKIINVDKTIKLIQQLIKKQVKIIFASSDTVFGGYTFKVSDTERLMPRGKYGEMKAEVETLFISEKLVKVVRFSYVFDKSDKFTMMLNNEMKNGKEVQIFSGFERSVVALEDVLNGLVNIVESWNMIQSPINFSGPELISREGMVSELAKNHLKNLKYRIIEAPEGFWNSRSRIINTNCERFEALLGKVPLTIKQAIKNWEK
jgi:nucleoside-diphosphate-sugar epimerase